MRISQMRIRSACDLSKIFPHLCGKKNSSCYSGVDEVEDLQFSYMDFVTIALYKKKQESKLRANILQEYLYIHISKNITTKSIKPPSKRNSHHTNTINFPAKNCEI